jgi:hypothetical protein
MSGPGERESADPRVRYEIWVSCQRCGDVVVPGERCSLQRWSDGQVQLAYGCDTCSVTDTTPVDPGQLERLLDRGFVVAVWPPPTELLEPRPIGAPFTLDDVLDAHLLLTSTGVIVPLVLNAANGDH